MRELMLYAFIIGFAGAVGVAVAQLCFIALSMAFAMLVLIIKDLFSGNWNMRY